MPSDATKLRELVTERLALDTAWRDDGWMSSTLEELTEELQLATVSSLLVSLEKESLNHPCWIQLIERLTISETYFFRDQGQMELLQNEILPQLIKQADGRHLRVWSAGCSTGEELYSIAMLIDGLGYPSVDLVGTDVNPRVIASARRGVYRERSMRALPERLRKAYLHSRGRELHVASRLKTKTRFMVENLMDSGEPPVRGVDLIVCRNVLIYLERERIPPILQRFYRALRPLGLLMTGHGELIGIPTPFETQVYPQSLLHRRPEFPGRQRIERLRDPGSRATAAPATAETTSTSPASRGGPRTGSGLGPSSVGARSVLPLPTAGEPDSDGELLATLYRQARAARRDGKLQRARELVRKSLYLDPEAVEPYLELALLSLPDQGKAHKYRTTALELLAQTGSRTASETEIREALAELERLLP